MAVRTKRNIQLVYFCSINSHRPRISWNKILPAVGNICVYLCLEENVMKDKGSAGRSCCVLSSENTKTNYFKTGITLVYVPQNTIKPDFNG